MLLLMDINMLPYVSIYVNMLFMDQCCPPVFGAKLEEDDAADLAQILKAVADPNRLKLLHLIAASGEVCGCDLTEPLGLSQPTVSHHLNVLAKAGFLERSQRGKWAHYRVVPERLDQVVAAFEFSTSV